MPAKPSSTDAGLPSKQCYCQYSLFVLGKGGNFGINYTGKKLVCKNVMCLVSL